MEVLPDSPSKSQIFSQKNYQCPICENLIVEPITNPCKHILCKSCHDIAMNIEAICVICHQTLPITYNAVTDKPLQQLISETQPIEYEKRKQYQIAKQIWSSDLVSLRFTIGNDYEKVKHPEKRSSYNKNPCIHRYTLYFDLVNNNELTSEFVEKVDFYIHPSYKFNKVSILHYPFRIRRVASGSFYVRLVVHYKSWMHLPKQNIRHKLKFEPMGKRFEYVQNLDRRIFQGKQGSFLLENLEKVDLEKGEIARRGVRRVSNNDNCIRKSSSVVCIKNGWTGVGVKSLRNVDTGDAEFVDKVELDKNKDNSKLMVNNEILKEIVERETKQVRESMSGIYVLSESNRTVMTIVDGDQIC